MPTHPSSRGLSAVLLGAALLGFAAVFVKWASAGGASDFVVGFYRMAFAVPGIWLLARREGRGPIRDPRSGEREDRTPGYWAQCALPIATALGSRNPCPVRYGGGRRRRGGASASSLVASLGAGPGRLWALAAGATFFLDLWGWHASMQHTSAANATLLVGGLSPIWVALFSVFFLRLRFGPLGWIGQAAGLGGALVLGLARGARVGDGLGESLALAASFAYASYTLVLGRSRRSLKATQALFWTSLACLVCFAVAAILRGDAFTGFTPKAWMSLVGLGLAIQLLAWWLISWGLGHVDAALGAIGLQAQQVATILLAWPMLGEVPKPLGLLGALLIAAGIGAVAASPRHFAQASK